MNWKLVFMCYYDVEFNFDWFYCWAASTHSSQTEDDGKELPAPAASEVGNISLLLFLYVLQGIPLGLSASIPMILQNKGVSYKEQVCLYLTHTNC